MASEEEMQEKLKNMSPEELKKFQAQNCIFCHIIGGKVASKKVYEDGKCLAILDINPANPGHVLLMPKEHYSIMPLIPEDVIKHIFMISKQISASLLRALKAQGTNIFVANGAAAGQKAQHFMVHIIPRMEKDGVGLELKGKKADEKILEDLRKVLVEKINKDFDVEIGETVEEKKVKEPSVVEAEFKETKKKKQAPKKSKKAVKTAKKTSKKGKATKKKTSKEEDVSLDDISNLITGGS